MTRAQIIKKQFAETGVFKTDDGRFACGTHIDFEMERDMKAMRNAIRYINDYIERNPIKTFGDLDLKNTKEVLESRLNEYTE